MVRGDGSASDPVAGSLFVVVGRTVGGVVVTPVRTMVPGTVVGETHGSLPVAAGVTTPIEVVVDAFGSRGMVMHVSTTVVVTGTVVVVVVDVVVVVEVDVVVVTTVTDVARAGATANRGPTEASEANVVKSAGPSAVERPILRAVESTK